MCICLFLYIYIVLHSYIILVFSNIKFDISCLYNSFQSNNDNYIQILGTAMGIKMAPIYATLTLANLGENLYEIIGKKYRNDIKGEFTKSWKRYLDDCFIFWKCLCGHINEIHNLFQNLHPEINFTVEHSSKELSFLDILIKSENGQIITDIKYKPTDTHQYPHFNSHHPKNCKKIHPLHSST